MTLAPRAGLAEASGEVAPGELVAHALHVPEGTAFTVGAALPGERAVLIAYGPRDAQGGLPGCRALRLADGEGAAARAELRADTAEDAGEYVVLVGARPGHGGAYTVTAACTAGCEDGPASCPTLADRGCPGVRCDGELARDADGCLTCACAPGRLCAPGRAAGPWGTCVLPACTCPDAAAVDAVCGADGRTWASPCHAACAGVGVARAGACEDACPALADCEAPCFGPRAIDPDSGCPTCACGPALPDSDAACDACPPTLAPVCGSDGVTYANRCEARCAGARLLYAAACVDGCRAPPEGCEADCAWGLRLALDAPTCTACACAPAPPASCLTSGAPLCTILPGLPDETTVGSPCLALHLGATEARWGGCGLPCSDDADCGPGGACPAGEALFADRCVADGPSPCGCSDLVEPVCGEDEATYPNACHAWCAGVAVAGLGACCDGGSPGGCDP